MVRFEDFYNEILSGLIDGYTFNYQVLEKDEKLQKKEAEELTERLQSQLPNDIRIICLDVGAYSDFESLFSAFVDQIYESPSFDESDTGISRENILNTFSVIGRRKRLKSVLSMDFAEKGIKVLLVLYHYEAAGKLWTDVSEFGYMRGLLDDVEGMSAVIFSGKTMREVSEEPVGSSPFWNIFCIPAKEIKYE